MRHPPLLPGAVPPDPDQHDPTALYRRIQDTLRESVRLHMRSDVPVGAFLSCGIDSTAVVALAREFNPNILTFTVGYDVPGYSEIEVAQDSARHLDVTTIPTKIGPQDMMDALPQIVWHLDDPVADPALVPLYFVAKKAAEHVTVVLSGEGADEFFGGYTIYREPLSLAGVNGLPDPVQRGLRAVSKAIPEGVKGKSFLERGTTPIEERYYGNARIFTEEEKRAAAAPVRPDGALHRRHRADLRRGRRGSTTSPRCSTSTSTPGCAATSWSRPTGCRWRTRWRLRVPFLDREVFEVAAGIPVDLKLPPRSVETKFALRRALRGRGAAGHRQPQEARLPDARPGSGSRARCTSGPATSWPAPAPVSCSTWSTRSDLLDAHQRGRGGQLPRGVDGAGLLHLARHLRGALARPGHRAQPVRPAHQARRRLDGPLTGYAA